MAAAGEVECVDERMHPDINELLSKTVRRYPFLYDKTLKEFKDRKMKSQKLNISQFTYRMLASLPEIIFPVTQPKLFDKVIVLAICLHSLYKGLPPRGEKRVADYESRRLRKLH